ncbi:MAG: hypothetical protein KIT46_01665 [Anaerolineales bacterium]|nr:hypothetical protein [Anaerolineales bacterium]MCW5854731.1 hypothetical protein [Anaerolineales bacterium]
MATNVIQMPRMNSSPSTFGHLLEQVVLVTLITAVTALALLLLFSLELQVSLTAMKYAALGLVGLVAGFSARRLLAGRSYALRLSTAGLAICLGLGLMNEASRGFIGIDPLHQFAHITFEQNGLALLTSSLAAWLALSAFARPRTEILVEPRPAASLEVAAPVPPISVSPAPRPRVRAARPARRPTIRTSIANWSGRVKTSLVSLWPGRRVRRGPSLRQPRQRIAAPAAPKRTRRGRRTAVHFSSAETHVCPYCLEEVTKKDPRGVQICKVCKTWHHRDCWEITGVCQVPHQYAE